MRFRIDAAAFGDRLAACRVLGSQHLLLWRAVSELRVCPTQIGDRHRHLTRILGHDCGPRKERVPAVEDDHIFILVGIAGVKQALPPNNPENNLFSLTLSVTNGGRLACWADTRWQPAMGVHSKISATEQA